MKTMQKKYWTSQVTSDRTLASATAEIGAWPVETPDEEIIKTLLDQCADEKQRATIRAGRIVVGEWTD